MSTAPSIERRISELEKLLLPPKLEPIPVAMNDLSETSDCRDRQYRRKLVLAFTLTQDFEQYLADHGKRQTCSPGALREKLWTTVAAYRLVRRPGSFESDNRLSTIKIDDSPWVRTTFGKVLDDVMMRATIDDIDNAVVALHEAVDRLTGMLHSRRAKLGVTVRDQQELIRREVAARQWIDDPNGFRAGVGPADYRARCGL